MGRGGAACARLARPGKAAVIGAQTLGPDHGCTQWLWTQLPASVFLCFSFSCCWSVTGAALNRWTLAPFSTGSHFCTGVWLPAPTVAADLTMCPLLAACPHLTLQPHLAHESLSRGLLLREPKLRQPPTNRSRYSSRSVFFTDYGGKYQKQRLTDLQVTSGDQDGGGKDRTGGWCLQIDACSCVTLN